MSDVYYVISVLGWNGADDCQWDEHDSYQSFEEAVMVAEYLNYQGHSVKVIKVDEKEIQPYDTVAEYEGV